MFKMTDKPAIIAKPEFIPDSENEQKVLQQANKNFWENHPMSYDWTEEIEYPKFSKEFYTEVDRRFFESVRPFMPWKKEPFEALMPLGDLHKYDVLEIGVGNGSHAQLLARYAKSFTGIDLTTYATKSTQERLRLFNLKGNIINMDAERMSFEDNSFDFVWSWGVIHHSSNTSKIIDEIKRVLKPGGKAIIMVYYRSWWDYYLKGFLFHGIFKGRLFKGNIHKIAQQATDGALARYYTIPSWKKLISGRLKITKSHIMGMKAVLFPLPAGRFKNSLISIFPNSLTRFLTNNFRMGGFLVVHMEKE